MQHGYKIYTCGKMYGLSYAEQMNWRREIAHEIIIRSKNTVHFHHPPIYYNYESMRHKSEAEVMEYDLCKMLECDILVVNLNDVNSSVGSCFEIATAKAMNSFGKKHIYIVGVGDETGVHPWILECMIRREKDVVSAAKYIAAFLTV